LIVVSERKSDPHRRTRQHAITITLVAHSKALDALEKDEREDLDLVHEKLTHYLQRRKRKENKFGLVYLHYNFAGKGEREGEKEGDGYRGQQQQKLTQKEVEEEVRFLFKCGSIDPFGCVIFVVAKAAPISAIHRHLSGQASLKTPMEVCTELANFLDQTIVDCAFQHNYVPIIHPIKINETHGSEGVVGALYFVSTSSYSLRKWIQFMKSGNSWTSSADKNDP